MVNKTDSHLRIEVPFFCLHWEMKGHRSHVNLVKHEALPKDLHAIRMIYTVLVFFYFPMQTKKCTSILIFMLKRQITPKKSKRSMPVSFIGKCLPQFSYASSQVNAMGV